MICTETGAITLFQLPPDLEEKLETLYRVSKIRVFNLIWNAQGQKADSPILLEAFVDSLYKPVMSKLRLRIKSTFDETITLNKVRIMFKDYSNDVNGLMDDLKLLVDVLFADDEPVIIYRMQQNVENIARKILQSFELQVNQKKAENIVKIGSRLNLSGNFDIYEDIERKVRVYCSSTIFSTIVCVLLIWIIYFYILFLRQNQSILKHTFLKAKPIYFKTHNFCMVKPIYLSLLSFHSNFHGHKQETFCIHSMQT